jgi:hypothetical protein
MNPTDLHPDALAQAHADALEGRPPEAPGHLARRAPDDLSVAAAADAAAVAEYRLLHRAVRAAPMPALPAGFAARLAAQVRDLDESAAPESWTMMLAGACALAAAALFALPVTAGALQQALAQLDGVPWPMLLTAAGALAVAWAGDRVAGRRALPQAAAARTGTRAA